jgi:hypothetical protein
MSEVATTKYSSYTPAQKRASQLYRQKNKDKINEQRKKYYQNKKSSDPTFLEYKRMKAKEYYEKKKLDKVVKPDAKMSDDMIVDEKPDVIMSEPVLSTPVIIPEPETKMEIDSPEISVAPSEPVKRKRASKTKKLKVDVVKV